MDDSTTKIMSLSIHIQLIQITSFILIKFLLLAHRVLFHQHEKITPVWIAPYEDSVGNYHEINTIHTVTQPGYWVNHPIC